MEGVYRMNLFIILISVLFSAAAGILMLKRTKNKWVALLFSFYINTVILISVAWILYNLNEEAKYFVFAVNDLYELIFPIPLFIWVHYFILEIVRVIMVKRLKMGRQT